MDINSRECKYLVGIDFGDGETTASYIDLVNPSNKDKVLSLKIVNSNDGPDSTKVESCIYLDPDGDWDFATEPEHYYSGTAESYFKEKVQILNDSKYKKKKLAFIEFIKLVFNRILQNNSFLEYNPQTRKKNFYLAVACPSRWGKDVFTGANNEYAIREYQKLLSQYLPIDGMIKESDAAYFNFHVDREFSNELRKTLVIDYGSSTIDFTFYDLSQGREIDSDGTPGRECGASKIEQCILDYIEQYDPDYQKAEATIELWLQKYEDTIEWKNALLHEIKKHKENYYGNRRKKLGRMKVELRDIYSPSKEDTTGLYFFNNIELSSDCIENNCLKEYKQLVFDEIRRIGEKWDPEQIIITGGASRMFWVKPMVEDIFKKKNESTEVGTDDKTPSYVVSNGIVKYLLHLKSFNEKFDSLKKEFLSGYHFTQDAIIGVVNDALTLSVQPIVAKKIERICNSYIENNLYDSSFASLARSIDECGLNFYSEISELEMKTINDTIRRKLQEKFIPLIEDKIRNTFSESFSMSLEMPITIDYASFVNNGHQLILYANDKVQDNAQIGFWERLSGINMQESRDSETRRATAQSVLSCYKTIMYQVAENTIGIFVTEVTKSVDMCFENARKQIPFTIY